jgi:hypothetical protein
LFYFWVMYEGCDVAPVETWWETSGPYQVDLSRPTDLWSHVCSRLQLMGPKSDAFRGPCTRLPPSPESICFVAHDAPKQVHLGHPASQVSVVQGIRQGVLIGS